MKSFSHIVDSFFYRVNVGKAKNQDKKLSSHILVIESDDWGSIRIPSVETLERLKTKGHRFAEHIGYDRYDTLASNEDLEVLIEALSSVRGADGRPAKLTMNCVVANPDFDRIRQADFQEYHYELFTETLKRYPHHDRSFSLWKEGIKEGVLKPQFHGREHLNAQMWLKLLRQHYLPVVDSFEERVFSTQVEPSVDVRRHSLAAYNIESEEEYTFAKASVKEGLDQFEKLFGFRSISMIAPNYTWDSAIEDEAFACGVRYIQGSRIQRHSQYVIRNGGKTEIRHTGQRNANGQFYLVRNCSFEPSENPKKNADYCLAQISNCFKRGQAAIISSHRQNFIGELYPENRDNNIRQLKYLLTEVVKRFPDVRFLSSDELGLEVANAR